MLSFGGKKSKSGTKPATRPKSKAKAGEFPDRQKLLQIERVLCAVRIGSRIRYHQEYDEASMLESLVVGYQFDDHQVFRQSDLEVHMDEREVKMLLCDGEGSHSLTQVENFDLLVPDTDGDELKLDYDSRASLSRRGPFAPRSRLVVMSSSFCSNTEHLKFSVAVRRRQKLQRGVHAGLNVVSLDVGLASVDVHEPRKTARLPTDLFITASKNGVEPMLEARLRDIADNTVRLALDGEGDWPEFGKKDHLMVNMKSALDKPILRLRCDCIESRGEERVFRITHITRPDNKPQPFQQLDALEIKIDLMNLNH